MSHFDHGPLATYNSLTDTHLAGYFANTRTRRHLIRAGLVSKNGVVVSETTYRLNMSRKEHKKHVKDMLAQAIVHKTLDLERSRQAEIKKKLEEIAKIQLVRRVRASRARKGDEDILPLLTLKKSRPYSSPTSKPRQPIPKSKHRPYSAPGVRADSRLSQTSTEEDEDVLYLDDEGRPINSASHRELGSGDHVDTRHLYALDTTALRRYAMMMSQMEQGGGHTSPYLMAQVPLPPRLPLSGRSPRSARRLKSVSPQRPGATDGNIARLHRSESAKMHEGQQQSMCKVTMRYHGWELHLAREQVDLAQEIQVEQQHCGGNTLTVFKERLVPGSEFSFISYRHRGYPFSLTLYVDGHVDSRVSTCCEARHVCGAKIGGKQGHFSLVCVDGAVPCYKCQVAKGVMIRNKAPRKQTKRPPQHHVEEVIVVSSTKDSSDKDKSAVNRSQETQDEEKPVQVAVERDDDNQQDNNQQTAKESKKDDYEDDFDPSGSSSLSSSSSVSESESEGTVRKDRDEEGSGTSGSRGKDFHPLNTQHRAQSTSPPPSPKKREIENTREVHSPNQPKTGDATRTRYGDGSAGDKSSGRVDVNGTGRKIDDFSSDEDGNDDDKKATILSMDKVEAEEETSLKRSSRSSRSSSQSSSRSSSSSRSEEEKNSPTVVSVQTLDDDEGIQQRISDARSRDQSGQKAEERSQRRSGQHQGLERQHQREQQERQQQQQQEKAREMEERRRAEELRRQREKIEQQKREEASRRMEEERRAEAQREAEGRAERRRQEEGQRRPDSVTSSDDPSREEARQKAQQQRELEILEGQRLREEKWRAEKQAREEAWKREEAQREQELRGVEKKREEGFSSARATPTSSSPAKSVSVTSESDADSWQRTGTPEDGRKEQESSAASPSTHLTSQTETRKPKGKEEGIEEDEEETSGEKSPSVGRIPLNFLQADDQASTAPASSRTAGSSRSSGQDSASSDSSSTDSSSSSDSESESDNNGSAHTAKEKENVSAHTAKETDRYGKTRREDVQITERQRPHTGAAPEELEDAMPAPPAGGEEKLSRDQVDGVGAALAAREAREARQGAAEDNNDSPAARLSPPAKVPPSLEPAETREASADSSSSSSDSMTSLSGRSSSRASSQQHREEDAPSDVLESDRRLGRVADDREHRGEEHVSLRPARGTAEDATPTANDDAGRMLQPPPAPAEERPSSFSSLDDDVWKLLGREGPHKPVNSDEEFLIDGEQPVLHDKTEISGDRRLQETAHSPGSTSLEVSVLEHLLGEESVELPNISLSTAQVQEVASHLAGADKVSAINLRNTRLHDEDVEKLSASIAASPSEPEMLNLSLNSLTEKSVRHLLNLLKAKPSVKLLLLQGNHLGDEGVGQLMSGLQDLQREARAQRKFASDAADTMSVDSSASSATTDQNLVPRKYILRDLDLASTGMTDAGAARVGELLAGNVYIEALRLSANEGVTPEVGWACIGEGLSRNRCLRSLALDGNRLGDAGAKQLTAGLHTNRALTSLKLQHAGIGEEGGRAIMEMLKRNTTIQDLTLTPGNAIPDALMGDINKYVALNRASGPGVPKR